MASLAIALSGDTAVACGRMKVKAIFISILLILLCSFGASVRLVGPPGPPAPPPSSPGRSGSCSNEGSESANFNFWYRCERDAETKELIAKVMGCVSHDDPIPEDGSIPKGKHIGNGATFHFRDTVIQCLHDDATDTWTQAPVGCLGSGHSEHKAGEEWEEGEGTSGDPRIKYKMRCDKNGFIVRKQAVKCVYSSSDGQGELDGGCMKKFGNTLVQCVQRKQQKGQHLRAQIVIAPNAQVEQDAGNLGVKYC